MAIPRSQIYDNFKPVTCHCVSRCVRRTGLLASETRRRALRDRLAQLVRFFAIDVLEWSLLTNHFHLVASTHPDLASLWTREEVARRWRTLSPDYAWRRRHRIPLHLPAQQGEIDEALQNPTLVERWRGDLANLSTFHKFLKQKLARIINIEEDVTGHCFEGRFRSIVALDEEAIIAHMVYVALNPVRARMADSLASYEFSSIAGRVEELRRQIADGQFAGEVEAARRKLFSVALQPAMPCEPGQQATKAKTLPDGRANPWFGGGRPSLLRGQSGTALGAIGLASYIIQIDATGRSKRPNKRGVIPPSTPSPLREIERIFVRSKRQSRRCVANDPAWASAEAMIEEVEIAMDRGTPGNYSGSAATLMNAARDTGRRVIAAVGGLLALGRSRVSAAEEPNVTDSA